LVYQRFSPQEQHGCTAGGATNVIASLLAGAEAGSDSQDSSALSDYQRECQLGAQQENESNFERSCLQINEKCGTVPYFNLFQWQIFGRKPN